ncbi:putative phage abortive infection protein [Vibrio harveyi]|uniref:putative phage abortive infection protein n=1 Tax=Vibrio harveyi TaxID=669 RepID=UPI0036F3432D
MKPNNQNNLKQKPEFEENSHELVSLAHAMIISVVLVGLLLFAYYVYVQYQNAFEPFEKVPEVSAKLLHEVKQSDVAGVLGTRGDYFGGLLNPVLAFVSLMALLYTIILQTKELSMTRRELEKTAEANEQQAKALAEQVYASKAAAEAQQLTAKQQQFDATFSTLLAEHSKVLSELADDTAVLGVLKFKTDSYIEEPRRSVLGNAKLCKYYRVLYQVLKFIARNHPVNTAQEFSGDYLRQEPSKNEKAYSSLVRSMIPSDVLQGLAANCAVFDRDNSDFLEYILLVERYAMLEHLDVSSVIQGEFRIRDDLPLFGYLCVYKAEAFGNNTSLNDLLKSIVSLLQDSEEPRVFDDLIYDRVECVPMSVMSSFIRREEILAYKERALAELNREF